MVIINKCDINSDMSKSIEQFIASERIFLLAKIPFDKQFIKAIQNSKSIIDYDHTYIERFKTIWKDIQKIILN